MGSTSARVPVAAHCEHQRYTEHIRASLYQQRLVTPVKCRRSSLPDELIAAKSQESVERITNRSVLHPLPHAPVKLNVLDEPGAVIGDDTTFCRPGPSLLGPVPLPFKASLAVCSQLLCLVIKSLWNAYICPYTKSYTCLRRCQEVCWNPYNEDAPLFGGGNTKKKPNLTTWVFLRGQAVPQRLMWTTGCRDEGKRPRSIW